MNYSQILFGQKFIILISRVLSGDKIQFAHQFLNCHFNHNCQICWSVGSLQCFFFSNLPVTRVLFITYLNLLFSIFIYKYFSNLIISRVLSFLINVILTIIFKFKGKCKADFDLVEFLSNDILPIILQFTHQYSYFLFLKYHFTNIFQIGSSVEFFLF